MPTHTPAQRQSPELINLIDLLWQALPEPLIDHAVERCRREAQSQIVTLLSQTSLLGCCEGWLAMCHVFLSKGRLR
jgi:hypothetical protein